MRIHPVMARALVGFAPPVTTSRHYRTASIRIDAQLKVAGYYPGQRVGIRWCRQDRRGRDWYVISASQEFNGYSPVFCACVLENFSTQD